MMRSTGGPSAFSNMGRGQRGGTKIPMDGHDLHGIQMQRPSTRHGSDERPAGRPITQGISRRAAGLGQINTVKSNGQGNTIQKRPDKEKNIDRQQSLNQQAENTYLNQGQLEKHVKNRRTSSRGMNRIYGDASGNDSSFGQAKN